MNKNKERDKIDVELSKTYFGNTLRTINLNESPSGTNKNVSPSEKHKQNNEKHPRFPGRLRSSLIGLIIIAGRLRPFFIALAILAGLTLSVVYFLAHERLIFNLDINTTSTNEAANTAIPESIEDIVVTDIEAETVETEVFADRGQPVTEKILYDFENGDSGWEVPFWATEKSDHIALSLEPVSGVASSGDSSIRIYAEFVSGRWSAALIETQHYLDLREYNTISAKIYLPPKTIDRLRCKVILTVGDAWNFVEMARSVKLVPGKWTTITADISEDSIDWKRIKVDNEFKKDIRKIAFRITSNGMPYSGFIYIDEVTVSP